MNWSILVMASLLEAFIPLLIIRSKNYTDLFYTAALLMVAAASVMGLRFAMRSIPLSIAYIVWTSLGIVGTVVVGTIVLQESISLVKMGCILLMVVAVIGLRISSAAKAPTKINT